MTEDQPFYTPPPTAPFTPRKVTLPDPNLIYLKLKEQVSEIPHRKRVIAAVTKAGNNPSFQAGLIAATIEMAVEIIDDMLNNKS